MPTPSLLATGADKYNDALVFELCIVIDITGSMGNWIKRATHTIKQIIDQIVEDNKEKADTIVKVSIIGYRDILDLARFVEFKFTQDICKAKNFLSSLCARSKEPKIDRPEDIAGAFQLCLLQDWTEEAIKRVVLICDAPAHGFFNPDEDNYPAGTPDVRPLKELVEEFQ